MYVCKYVRMYVCMYLRMYVSTYVCSFRVSSYQDLLTMYVHTFLCVHYYSKPNKVFNIGSCSEIVLSVFAFDVFTVLRLQLGADSPYVRVEWTLL